MPRLCRSRVTSCAKSEFFITIVFSLVGTRGVWRGCGGLVLVLGGCSTPRKDKHKPPTRLPRLSLSLQTRGVNFVSYRSHYARNFVSWQHVIIKGGALYL